MRKNKKILSVILVFLVINMISPSFHASSALATDNYGDFIITEIMYDQSSDIDAKKTQWVEMIAKNDINFNLATNNQIKSFYLCARKSKSTGACTFYAVYSPDKITSISAGTYVIFTPDPATVRDVYDLSDDIITLKTSSSFSLLDEDNTANFPFISYSQNNKITLHEEILYGDFFDKKETGYSLERIDLDKENTKVNWRESCKGGGTPGSEPQTCEIEPDPPNVPDACVPSSADVKLNEIFPWPESGDEFIEIKNTGDACVDVSGWKIMDEAGHEKEFIANSTMDPGEYLLLEGNLHLNNDSDTVYFLDKSGTSKEAALESHSYEKAKKDFSYSFDSGWSWTSTPTPGAKNVITTPPSDTDDTTDTTTDENYYLSDKVYLNEIFPNPKNKSDEEYIEIANAASDPVDLYKWTIRDASKTGKYLFKEHTTIEPGGYLVIPKSQSKIALNNSGESVYLYNPQSDRVSSIEYAKSQKGVSYNFDGNMWRWSKYLTPGTKNKFDSKPKVKIKIPKNAYENISTEFSVKAKDRETKKLEYTWDFGDGRKSYLKNTSHKYLDTGKYTVTLTVSDKSQTIKKSFVVNVKKYPRPNLEILKIVPNPTGKDAEGEIIDLKNNSSKKENLEGWGITTGSDEKRYNHPIGKEVSLDPGETKTITREISRFTLNNKAGEVRLVSPDGKIVDEVEYAKEKIAEGEAYVKNDGEWRWIALPEEKKDPEKNDSEGKRKDKSDSNAEGEVLGTSSEKRAYYAPNPTRYTSEDEYIFLTALGFIKSYSKDMDYCPTHSSIPDLFSLLVPNI